MLNKPEPQIRPNFIFTSRTAHQYSRALVFVTDTRVPRHQPLLPLCALCAPRRCHVGLGHQRLHSYTQPVGSDTDVWVCLVGHLQACIQVEPNSASAVIPSDYLNHPRVASADFTMGIINYQHRALGWQLTLGCIVQNPR